MKKGSDILLPEPFFMRKGGCEIPPVLFLREHKGQGPGLEIGQNTKHQRHGNAVPYGEAEEVAFLSNHITDHLFYI